MNWVRGQAWENVLKTSLPLRQASGTDDSQPAKLSLDALEVSDVARQKMFVSMKAPSFVLKHDENKSPVWNKAQDDEPVAAMRGPKCERITATQH